MKAKDVVSGQTYRLNENPYGPNHLHESPLGKKVKIIDRVSKENFKAELLEKVDGYVAGEQFYVMAKWLDRAQQEIEGHVREFLDELRQTLRGANK